MRTFYKTFFFPFQQGQPKKGCTQVAAYGKQISFAGGAAFYILILFYFANSCDRYHKAFLRGRSVTANQVDIIFFTSSIYTFIKIFSASRLKRLLKAMLR